jgi:hypothetical protein
MTENRKELLEATPEQVLYARVLEKGMLLGLLMLLVTFIIYGFGILDSYIPVDKLSHYWSMDVTEYVHAAQVPTGWGWVGLLNYGDFLNFVGVAVLAGITILCYLAIIPTLLKNNDKLYALLALLEAAVLALAASGVLTTGGH